MSCEKLIRIENNERITKPKFKFDTLEDAIRVAKKMNFRNNREHKVVAYKCKECHKYHVGKNRTKLDISKIKPYWKDQ